MFRPEVAAQQYCYLTTRGRRSAKPHTIEIWFGLQDKTMYMLAGSGDGADWVRNLRANPQVEVRLDGRTYLASARVVTDPAEDRQARSMLVEKYQTPGSDELAGWGQTALPVAVDLAVEA